VRIDSPDPKPRDSGDYEIWISKGYGDPAGTITLDEEGDLVLRNITIGDCDRLIKAACEIKQKLTAYRAEMAAPHGRRHIHKGTCQLCGQPEDDELHAEAEPLDPPADVLAKMAARGMTEQTAPSVVRVAGPHPDASAFRHGYAPDESVTA
jgi:hypothetical protein